MHLIQLHTTENIPTSSTMQAFVSSYGRGANDIGEFINTDEIPVYISGIQGQHPMRLGQVSLRLSL